MFSDSNDLILIVSIKFRSLLLCSIDFASIDLASIDFTRIVLARIGCLISIQGRSKVAPQGTSHRILNGSGIGLGVRQHFVLSAL